MPPTMRFTNVGSFLDNGVSKSFDMVVANRSAYSAASPQSNGIQNAMAGISVACNSHVDLRVELKFSCTPDGVANCAVCAALRGRGTGRRLQSVDACYQAGCACFGSMVYAETECTGTRYEQRRQQYSCSIMDEQLVFPTRDEPVTMSVYDFDGEINPFGGYIAEQVTLSRYTHFATPLRPGFQYSAISTSTVAVEEVAGTLGTDQYLRATSTAVGNAADDPTDIIDLTPSQAAKGIQVFFKPERGYVDGTFAVIDTGVIRGFCTADRTFFIGGDSGLTIAATRMPSS